MSKTAPADSFSHLKGDLSGGLTAAIITLPMSIGYGLLAFAPLGLAFAPQAAMLGVTTAVIAGFLAALCGGTTIQVTGAQAALTLVVGTLVGSLASHSAIFSRPELMIGLVSICVFLAGLFQMVFSALGLSSLVKYIPQPVISGFMNGISILVIIKQVGPLLGAGQHITLLDVLKDPGRIHVSAFAAGLVTMAAVFISKRCLKGIPSFCTGLIAGTVCFYLFSTAFDLPVSEQTLGHLQITLRPTLFWPQVIEHSSLLPWNSIIPEIVLTSLVVCLLASMESMMSAVVCDQLTGLKHDSKRELMGQGIGNVGCAMFGALPAAGSVTRSAANFTAGGRTRLSGILSAAFVLLGVAVAGPWLGKIPVSVVAGIIAVVGLSLFDRWTLKVMKKLIGRASSTKELGFELFICLLVTVLTLAVNLIIAVVFGVFVACLVFISRTGSTAIKRIARGSQVHSGRVRSPEEMTILTGKGDTIVIVLFQGPLFFGSAEHISERIKCCMEGADQIILDFKQVTDVDITGARIIVEMRNWIAESGRKLMLSSSTSNARLWNLFEIMDVSCAFKPEELFADLDAALESAEDCLLAHEKGPDDDQEPVHLNDLALFEGFSPPDLECIEQKLKLRRYSQGEVVFRENGCDRDLFILMRGLMTIQIELLESGRSKRLVTYGPGTVVGEMSFLDGSPRSATVVASEDTEAFCLTYEHFQALRQDNPELATTLSLNIAKEISQRLRRTTDQLGQLDDSS